MQKDENGFPIPRRTFLVRDKHGDSCHLFAVFPVAEVEKEFPELMGMIREAQEHAPEDWQFLQAAELLRASLTPWHAFERGAGKAFGTCPVLHVGKHNVVIRQFRALDI